MDISKLSDAELMEMLKAPQQSGPDVSAMSDDDLLKALQQEPAANMGFAAREQREPTNPEFRASQAQAEYENAPWYQKPLIAADDIIRLGLDGLTSGYMDKAAGYLSGDVDAQREATQAARDRAGWAGTAAEVGGAVYGANKLVKGGAALVSGAKSLPVVGGAVGKVAGGAANLAARPGVVGLGARTAGAATVGAGLGALNAAGHDQDIGDGAVMGAIFGAGGNVLGEAVGKTVDKVAGGVGRMAGINKTPRIMTTDELKAASNAAYKAADDAGLIFKPTVIQRLAKEIEDDLADFGYMPELQPNVSKFLGAMSSSGNNNVTLKHIDQIRKVAGLLAKGENGAEREIAKQIIKKIDKHLDTINAGDILAGNRTQGVRALQEARKLWQSAKKSEMIEEAIEKAKNQAGSSYSGGNIDNAIRQQFKAILNDKKKSRGLTKDERAVMLLIVRGKTGEGLLRSVAKLSPNGSGLMTMLGLGGVGAFGPMALGVPMAGLAAKSVADSMTPGRVEQLSRIVRAGGNASATQAAPNAVQRIARQNSGALTLPLTVGGIVGAN